MWTPSLAFPGLREGEQLSRTTTLPRRATLLARDGSVLAESSGSTEAQSPEADRSYPLGGFGSAVVGSVGAVPAAHRVELEAQGVPPTALVGVSGLEQALDAGLRGTPGGELLAVDSAGHTDRVLASASARPAPAIRSTISPPRPARRGDARSVASSAASSRWSPPAGGSWRWRASAWTACNRPARRSRW